MILQVPMEIRTDQAARILADAAGPAGDAVVLPFRFCSAQRGGCFAELELRDDVALRGSVSGTGGVRSTESNSFLCDCVRLAP